MTSTNGGTRNKKNNLLNNMGIKHSLVMKYNQFNSNYKRKTFIKKFYKRMWPGK